MKKLIILPALFFATASLLLSCGSGNTTQSMKAPEQTNADSINENAGKVKEATEANESKRTEENEENENEEKNSAIKPASLVSSTDAKSKTIDR